MYIKRELEEKLKKYLNVKEIIAVVGPRQCGKTTLITEILKDLDKVNKLSFDDIKLKNLFETDIDSFIELHVKNYKYLFIDEIQYVQNSGKILKYIYDNHKIKIIISGSSAAEISIQSLKYLVGRIFLFKLHPFSFKEFLSYKNKKLLGVYESKRFGEEINKKLQKYIKEFIIYGGYPRVVLAKDIEEKILVLKNIYNTYLLKEIKEILELSENNKLILLLKALSLQIGNLLNYKELSVITGFSYANIKKYLQILEETYICQRCYSFHTNKRVELVKTPKIYFIDYGFRNICMDNFNIERTDLGAMYENLIFSEYLKKDKQLQYWRKKSGAEVDFVMDKTPIEIKTTPKTSKSFFSFISQYKPKEGYIISEVEKKTQTKNGIKIKFIPFSKYI